MKRILMIAGGLLALPFAINTADGTITANNAWCAEQDGGTCCPGVGTCFPNGCTSVLCSVSNSWWRTDGKRCEAF